MGDRLSISTEGDRQKYFPKSKQKPIIVDSLQLGDVRCPVTF
ncbi:MAG: hypothetical protein WBB82_17460 [Limnothrix sp.]